MEQNLQQARGKWGQMMKSLGRKGVGRRMAYRFNVAVVQAVICFGSETWVVTSRLEKILAGLHHQAVRWTSVTGPKRQWDGKWVYPTIGAALATVGLDKTRIYTACGHNAVSQYIATLPVMDFCLVAEQRPGMRLLHSWWEQTALDILGIRAGHAAAEMGKKTGME